MDGVIRSIGNNQNLKTKDDELGRKIETRVRMESEKVMIPKKRIKRNNTINHTGKHSKTINDSKQFMTVAKEDCNKNEEKLGFMDEVRKYNSVSVSKVWMSKTCKKLI